MFFDEGLLKVLSFVIGNPPASAKIGESILLNANHVSDHFPQNANSPSLQAMEVKNDKVVFIVRPELD